MWSSKMAAQWRPIDEALNAGNVDFLSIRSPCQIGSCGGTMGAEDIDMRSCMEHSILAIFEEPAASSEDTRQAEEESETLLSALNQMLECVEDDVGSTLSPFDTLPDTKLLNCQQFGNSMTTDEVAFTAKLRPRTTNGAGKEDGSKLARFQPVFQHQSRTLFQGPNKKADTQVNIFTTSSLVNLVKLMHPYCLKMHVEEEGRDHRGTDGPLSPWDKLQKKHTMFSQGEVWKYKKPTADSDEDINVVSDDDDTPLKEREDKEGIAKKESSTPLKSAFLTSKSSKGLFLRAKKKVSFGPVQVASFDPSVEVGFDEKTLPSVAAADAPDDPVLVSPTTASILSDLNNQAEAPPPKGEGKTKSLSLQEYRQLRQKRQPLVEKKGSNTTRWPSVPKPPKELTPILCSHGQRQNLCEMKSSLRLIEKSTISPDPRQRAPGKTTFRHPPGPLDKKPWLAVRHRRSKSPQSESEHASLDGSKCSDEHRDPPVKGAASKTSPLKDRTPLSTDPPNPVIIRLPVSPMPNPSNSHSSLMSSVEHSVAASQMQQSATEPHSSDEVESYFPITPQTKSSSECSKPQNLMPRISQSVNSDPVACDQGQPVREVFAEGPTGCSRPSFEHTCRNQSAAAESGIEACDLTSLLEQFEEKQTEEADPAIFSNALPANPHKDTERNSMPTQTSTKEPKPVRTLHSAKAKLAIKYLERQRNLERVTPEPVSTEVILDTREVVSARRRTPASKGIQIIDPRPLPCRKTNATDLAAPPHICSSVSTDHDYCMPADDLHPRAAPSLLRNTREVEVTSSFVKCNQISIMKCDSPVRTDEKYQSASSACTPTAPSYTQLTPPPSPPSRGRAKRRYSRRSPLSDVCSSSSSSSPSRSPKRSHCEHSGSRSWSSSPSRSASPSPPRRRKLSCTCLTSNRSRAQSWSRSRSPSPSSPTFHTRRRNVYRKSWKLKREHKARLEKLKAIDERRVVYVGRIRRSMTHDELRERFSYFGEVECVSLHFRDKGDHYGFVTFYRMDDAFAAIDNGAKLRRPDELPFDICFGGRRQFCNSDYADLDAKVDADPSPAKSRFQELDFDSLLKQAQRGLR